MKKIISILSVVIATCICTMSVFTFAGCSSDESYTAMQVDLNPSVEFILDKDNNVASVTALNDDGAVIIAGEAFVGKSAEDAVSLFVEVSAETGYLVKGEGSASDGEIKVSLSGNTDAAQKLYEKIEAKVESAIDDSGVSASIAKGDALKTETLRATVKVCYPELTDEELSAMSDEELAEKLAESRKETQDLISAAMREAYYKAKSYHVSLAENQAFGTTVCNVNSAYQVLMAGYLKGVETLKSAVDSIEETQYIYFISEDSAYQQAVASVLQAKKDVLVQKSKVAELNDGLEKTAAQAILSQKEAILTGAETVLETTYKAAETAFSASEATVLSAISALENLQSALPDEITSILTEKASEIDAAVNDTKNHFFEQFEMQYTQAIAAYKEEVESVKAQMKIKN